MIRNPDILQDVKHYRQAHGQPHVVVGFAAESQDLLANAHSKLERKGLEMIVANDISASDAGFASENNRVVLLDREGGHEAIELSSKATISERIIQRIAQLIGRN
jgi:phosphopantothenoylcysteine decarboxylase/phosphopantothenate--cysteine ligase